MTLPKEQRRQLERLMQRMERAKQTCDRHGHAWDVRIAATGDPVVLECSTCGRRWEVTER